MILPARLATLGAAFALACSARQPDPPRQVVWTHAPAADADAAVSHVEVADAAPQQAVARPITPILPTLSLENLRFREVSECARGACRIEGRSPFAPADVAVEDGATTLPPAMAWVEVIRPGASVILPRRPGVDVLGVVLVGDVSINRETRATAAAPPHAGRWTAFYAGEGDLAIRPFGRDTAAVLLVTAEGAAEMTESPPLRSVALRDLSTLEDLSWAGGAMHARIAFEAPASTRASLGLLIASDDARVAEHDHPTSWEVLSTLSASGRLNLPAQTVAGRALPERDRTVTDGTIAYVPSGVRHAWHPDGTHPLIAVQVYAPAGPEQRFRALARRGETTQNPPAAQAATSTGASTP